MFVASFRVDLVVVVHVLLICSLLAFHSNGYRIMNAYPGVRIVNDAHKHRDNACEQVSHLTYK